MISKTKQWIKDAYDQGYRMKDNKCYNPNGKEIGYIDKRPGLYKMFTATISGNKKNLKCHMLVAYQIYKENFFDNVIVRHKDHNSLNNNEDNIILGSVKENAHDIHKDKRSQRASLSQQTQKRLRNGLRDSIIKDCNNKMSSMQISLQYQIHQNTVQNIIKRHKSQFCK